MKFKVNDLYNLTSGLNDLVDKELPISTSLKIQRNQKKVSEEVIPADKVRQQISEKYKEKDVEGGIKIKSNKMDEFKKEINELMDQEVDINLAKIKTSDLEGISIKPRSISMLESILDIE